MATTESIYTRRDQNQLGDTSTNNRSSPTPSSASSSTTTSSTTPPSHSMALGDTFNLPTAPPTSSSSNDSATPRDRRRSFTYESTSPNGSSEASPSSPTPLSMSFIHKPSRSQSFFTQSNDRTRENSIFNKTLSYSPEQRRQLQLQQLQQLPTPQSQLQSQELVDATTHTTLTSSSSSSSPSTSQLDKSPTASPSPTPIHQQQQPHSQPHSPQPIQSTLDTNNDHFAPPDYFNHKSALKSVTRSKSLPSTPTFKVHFGNSDIRYFKKKDTPKTISASNSPNFGAHVDSSDDYDDDDDDDDDDNDDDDDGYYGTGTFGSNYNYGYTYSDEDDVDDDVKRISSRGGGVRKSRNKYNHDDLHNFSLGDTKYPITSATTSTSEIKWDLQLLNFAPLSYLKRIETGTPVFLERLFISADKKYLFGHIAVKNLAFEKYLTVRYSVDNWMTIIEIPTTYTEEKADVLAKNNYDRFTFKIPLENLFNTFKMSKNSSTDSLSEDGGSGSSSSSTSGDVFRGSSYGDYQKERRYQFCIKYCTQGHEYWDNNRFQNYLVKLVKSRICHHPPPQRKHHFYNLENKDSKLQDHTMKPRYSSSYLKRVGSDSGISYNSPGVTGGAADDEANDSDAIVTLDVDTSGGGVTSLRENIEE